jgi:hypothetical protein
MKIRIALFLTVVFIGLAGCDLLNKPETDMGDLIDEAVAWANAARLTVSVDYIGEWGGSNPVRGTITPAMDIRKGYEFEIEFTPNAAYSFQGWRAYKTQAITAWGAIGN